MGVVRWRLLLATASIGILVAQPSTAGAAGDDLSIREAETSAWPEIRLVVSVDGTTNPDEFVVREEGREVDASVTALDGSSQALQVVLVMDTSGSMEGEALASEVEAAETLIEDLPPGSEVGVVAFADRPALLQKLTSDTSLALSAARDVHAAGETALYDGVEQAASMFQGEGQRYIVVMSDGSDTASRTSLDAAARSVVDSGATVFSIGLNSDEFDAGALRELASLAGGRYEPAASAQVSGIYEDLAAELSNQYEITYTSDAASQSRVQTEVLSPGGSDTVSFLTPETAGAPGDRTGESALPGSEEQPGTQDSLVPVVALGVFFLCVFMLAALALSTRERSRRGRYLNRLVARAPAPKDRPGTPEATSKWVPESLVKFSGRMAQTGGYAIRIDDKLEHAGWSMKTGEFLAICAMAALGGFIVGGLFLSSIVFALFLAAIAGAVPVVVLTIATRRRAAKMHDQLADILGVLASSLRAGHSFLQALDMVAKEIGDPGAEEFGRLVAEIRLGRSVGEALDSLADRIDSDDFRWAMIAVNVQREVGGNLAEVLDKVAETIRERDTVRRQVKALSAEGRLSMSILGALPFVVAAYIFLVNPDYLSLLFTRQIGLVLLTIGATLMAVGFLWMKKVVKIDV